MDWAGGEADLEVADLEAMAAVQAAAKAAANSYRRRHNSPAAAKAAAKADIEISAKFCHVDSF